MTFSFQPVPVFVSTHKILQKNDHFKLFLKKMQKLIISSLKSLKKSTENHLLINLYP